MSNYGARALVTMVVVFVLCLGVGLFTGTLLPKARFRAPVTVTTNIQDSIQILVEATLPSAPLAPSLQETLHTLLGSGDPEKQDRLAAIERTLQKTFPALPKNSEGRVGPRAVRYLVHRHFAQEDAWRIKGLEPSSQGFRIRTMGQPGGMLLGHAVTSDHEVRDLGFLQKKAPELVQAMEQLEETGRGFELGDAAAVIMILENLIVADSLGLLDAAYKVNNVSTREPLGSATAYKVAVSFLGLFDVGSSPSDANFNLTLESINALHEKGLPDRVKTFANNTLLKYQSEHQEWSKTSQATYSYKNMSHVAEHMVHDYGKWQNHDCQSMKKDLVVISDPGTGRVPLERFWAAPRGESYSFAESIEELQRMGALDDSVEGSFPMVVLSNYVLAPSNCLISTSYYSVCCLNECEGLMAEVETLVSSPSVEPNHLLSVISGVSSASVAAPRTLSESLREKLTGIARHHGGEVPLHSRLFAQWMHFAFPNECPYPQVYKARSPSAPLHPEDFFFRGFEQLEADKAEFLAKARTSHNGTVGPKPLGQVAQELAQWTDDEVLLLQETHKHGEVASIICLLMQVTSLVVVLNMALAIWQAAHRSKIKGLAPAGSEVVDSERRELQPTVFLA